MKTYRENPEEHDSETPKVFSQEQLDYINERENEETCEYCGMNECICDSSDDHKAEKYSETCIYCGMHKDFCECDEVIQWTERLTGDLNNDR